MMDVAETLAVAQTAPLFDVSEYVRHRAEKPDFLMVELGHGMWPVVSRQPAFSGQRAYIGIEAWLRDQSKEKRQAIGQLIAEREVDHNIFFLDQNTKTRIERDSEATDEVKAESWLVGSFDPVTILPDAVADEVFLSNVFGDPHIAYNFENTRKLAKEAARLLLPGGKLILRETISPYRVDLDKLLADAQHLMLDQVVRDTSSSRYAVLENVFGNDDGRGYLDNQDFYAIMTKVGTA